MKLGKILGKITPFLDSPIGEILTAVVPGLGAADKVLEALGVGEDEHVGSVLKGVQSLPESERRAPGVQWERINQPNRSCDCRTGMVCRRIRIGHGGDYYLILRQEIRRQAHGDSNRGRDAHTARNWYYGYNSSKVTKTINTRKRKRGRL